MRETVLYEVYSRAALRRGIAGLLCLHWSTSLRYAKLHARDWGGCVVRLRCVVRSMYPLQRDPPSAQDVVYVAPTTAVAWDAGIGLHELRGELMRGFGGRIPRYKTRKR